MCLLGAVGDGCSSFERLTDDVGSFPQSWIIASSKSSHLALPSRVSNVMSENMS